MAIQKATEKNKSGIAQKILNKTAGRKDNNQDKLKTENPEKRVKLWNEHFKKLLGLPIINTTPSSTRAIIGHIFISINTNYFKMEELNKTIK